MTHEEKLGVDTSRISAVDNGGVRPVPNRQHGCQKGGSASATEVAAVVNLFDQDLLSAAALYFHAPEYGRNVTLLLQQCLHPVVCLRTLCPDS